MISMNTGLWKSSVFSLRIGRPPKFYMLPFMERALFGDSRMLSGDLILPISGTITGEMQFDKSPSTGVNLTKSPSRMDRNGFTAISDE
jgi:hypothetical protein